jgi:hypothetical protein
VDVQGVNVIAAVIGGTDTRVLRNTLGQLKNPLKTAVIVLASVESSAELVLISGVAADVTSRVTAGELVGTIAAQVGAAVAGVQTGGAQQPCCGRHRADGGQELSVASWFSTVPTRVFVRCIALHWDQVTQIQAFPYVSHRRESVDFCSGFLRLSNPGGPRSRRKNKCSY